MIEKHELIQKTMKLLEFNKILESLALCSNSEEAAQIILKEEPYCDIEKVTRIKEAVNLLISLINSSRNVPSKSLPSIGFLFPTLSVEGTVLQIDEAYAIGIFIQYGQELKKWLLSETGELLGKEIPDLSGLLSDILKIIDKYGNLRDLPVLKAIKKRIQGLNAEIKTVISNYVKNDEIKHIFQSAVPTQRFERTVLAVKANYRGRIRGIVHEVSSSGQTVFIEPEIVVEKNNEILIETRNLNAEIKKIMLELTKNIAIHIEELKYFHLTVLNFEVLMSKARYSVKTKGVLAMEPSENFILVQAKHPLIANPVPIDLEIDEKIKALIITGPNTGGKTVAIKTAGLFAMMNQIGIALPLLEGSSLPIFDNIYADIGDEQSIGQSLSTFSSHIKNISVILSHCTSHSLVLLDELGSGTDPQEGSAIAMSILDYLIKKNTRVLVTTHHGILKNYGYSQKFAENASVEFNSQTLSPTYRIVRGISGESCALEIAEQTGINQKIILAARNYLDSGHTDLSNLIRALKEKHHEIDMLGAKAKEEDRRLTDERRKSDLKELGLKQKELEIKAGFAGKLRNLLDESRKTLENLVREVREGELSREKTLKVKEFLNDLARSVDEETNALEEDRKVLSSASAVMIKDFGEFSPGMEVYAGTEMRRGKLIRQNKKSKSWIVEIGSLKISISENEITPAPAQPHSKPQITTIDFSSTNIARAELNLRGMRLAEACEALRIQTDAALLCGLKFFSVIHGKGDGILQKGVHDWLKYEPSVEDYYFSRPELGGSGRTEVVLK